MTFRHSLNLIFKILDSRDYLDVTQIQWYDCKQWSTAFARYVIVRFARMESF